MPLCALADNPLETQEATGTDNKHARDIYDILNDLDAISSNKMTVKKKVTYYGGEYHDVLYEKILTADGEYDGEYRAILDDKTSTAGTNQRVSFIKQKIDNKIVYKQVVTKMLNFPELSTRTTVVIKDIKTGKTEALIVYPRGIIPSKEKIYNEDKVYEVLKGLYKNYRYTNGIIEPEVCYPFGPPGH